MIIRAEQMKTFEEAGARRFELEMAAHCKEFSPRLCRVLGDEHLIFVVRSAIARAGNYGFTFRGPIRLFIELTFLYGSAFDTDPQYPAIGEILRKQGDQMERAQRIHEEFLKYLESVSGEGAANVKAALAQLLAMAKAPLAFTDNFERDMLGHLRRVFPQKAAYVGEPALQALIHEAIAECRTYGFSHRREAALLVALKFAFGHGCTNDPLYPWIARTLRDEKITDASARSARLEKKAITWLEHVLATNDQGSRT